MSYSNIPSQVRTVATTPSAEHWFQGNSGRTIYSEIPSQPYTSSVAERSPPLESSLTSQDLAPFFSGGFLWGNYEYQPVTEDKLNYSTRTPDGFARSFKAPLGSSSIFPSDLDFSSFNSAQVDFGLNGQPGYVGSAPYMRSIEDEGLLQCVEPHWLSKPLTPTAVAFEGAHVNAPRANQSSDDIGTGFDSCFDSDDSFDFASSYDSSRSQSPVGGDSLPLSNVGHVGDVTSSRSSSPASSLADSSEEEYLPLARNIRMNKANRSLRVQLQKRFSPYQTYPRRNVQVDIGEDNCNQSIPPSVSSSIFSTKGATSSSNQKRSTSTKNKVPPELAVDALSCPICNFIPRGAIEDIETTKGLSSERRRTLKRHYESHFSSTRHVCVVKPHPDGSGTIGGCGKSLSRQDALLRHLKTCTGPSKRI